MRILVAVFFAVYAFNTVAQTTQVPHKMSFAGMTLVIRDDARRLIQKDVDALTQSPKHFLIKADRAKTYFPIIEKIFAEEGVPDDFKYLVLQESALIADAVSVSNAVGFWQFKDFTAMEMGLRVDHDIDERKNIAASTRAAARYIKKNNTFFDNWLYALQAYQMGAGGVLRSVKESHSGETDAEINSDTYWYVRKFLSYKIAFEDAVRGKGQVELVTFQPSSKQSLSALAKEFSIDEEELKSYNKWTKSGDIPNDRSYTVLVPNRTGLTLPVSSPVVKTDTKISTDSKTHVRAVSARASVVMKVNGIKAIQALEGETAVKLAERAHVDLASFLKWNDITISTKLQSGSYYLLGKKRGRAVEDYHKLVKGESLWSVSQKYGVRLKKLRKFNRLNSDDITPGTTLWLSSMKPKSEMNVLKSGAIAEVEKDETFNWTASPQTASTIQKDTVELIIRKVESVASHDSVSNAFQTSPEILPVTEQTNVTTDTTTRLGVVALNSKTTHTVQPKETLYAIAHQYNIGVMDLVKWNNLDLQQGLKIGQILKVSAEEPVVQVVANERELVHEVQASDTLYSIARKYGVTIKEIMDWNQKKDFSLSVGERLKVKGQ
jgi:membrane-bound lytic murein transglycosylase D